MTAKRNLYNDRQNTLQVLKSVQAGKPYELNELGRSWLEHRGKNAELDRLLTVGATMQELKAARKSVNTHIPHLKTEHGIDVIKVDGVYRMIVRD
jgi:hypothetical protein